MDENKIIRDSGCLNAVRNEAKILVSSLFNQRPEAKTFFSEKALNEICNNYLERMEMIYSQLIAQEIQSTLLAYKNINDIEAAAKKTAELTNGGNYNFFCQKYPLFAGYKERLEKNFSQAIAEFIDRFMLCKEQISEKLLDGKEITKINDLVMNGVAFRCHGRAVIGVKTNAGNFYYKPHNCEIDLMYEKIILLYFSDCAASPKVLSKSEYAFISEIVPSELKSETDAGIYFYNFGVITSLLCALGCRDIHYENVIPCGVFPVLIDVEALMHGESSAKDFDERTLVTNQDFYYSVIKTSVMPDRSYGNTITSPLYVVMGNTKHLPYYKEKLFTVENYEAEFIKGFSEGYKRVLKHGQEIIKLFEDQKNLMVRHVMYTSGYYYLILYDMLRPASMLTQETQDKMLKKFYVAIDPNEKKSTADNIAAYEGACMLSCDLPYYCVKVNSRDLCGTDISEIVQKDYFSHSPLEMLKKRIGRMSEKEYRFEEDYIKNFFRQLPSDSEPEDEFKISGKELDLNFAREVVNDIWHDLNKHIIRGTDDLPLWNSPDLRIEALKNGEPYSAWVSVALFCEKMKKCGFNIQHELAGLCMKALDMQIELWLNTDAERLRNKIPIGIYSGLGGIALTFAVYRDKALITKLLRLIQEKKLFDCTNASMDFGKAGLLMPLILMKREGIYEAKILDELISYGAEKVLNQKIDKLDVDTLAGIGAALSGAYYYTGEKKFADQSIKIFADIKDKYSDFLTGWPEGTISWLATKSPCSGSIAYFALEARSNLKSSEVVNDVTELALKSICSDENLLLRDSLYRGNAASVIALLKVGKREKAGQIISSMLDRYSKKKTFNVMPEGINNFFDPSFFFGTLGVGYAILDYLA